MESLISSADLVSVTKNILSPSSSFPSVPKKETQQGDLEMGGEDRTMEQGRRGEVSANSEQQSSRFSKQTQSPKGHSPKKRVVLLSAFLACLSFIIILSNSFISFANDLFRDDAFLKMFQKFLLAHNVSVSNIHSANANL